MSRRAPLVLPPAHLHHLMAGPLSALFAAVPEDGTPLQTVAGVMIRRVQPGEPLLYSGPVQFTPHPLSDNEIEIITISDDEEDEIPN